jgi:hypothetical protein
VREAVVVIVVVVVVVYFLVFTTVVSNPVTLESCTRWDLWKRIISYLYDNTQYTTSFLIVAIMVDNNNTQSSLPSPYLY